MQNQQLQNQLKQMSDRELLEGIYMMLLAVLQETKNDSKQLGINLVADLLVENLSRNKLVGNVEDNIATRIGK